MNIIESVRNLFRPIEHEVFTPVQAIMESSPLASVDKYEPLSVGNLGSRDTPSTPYFTNMLYSASSDYPVFAACTTAMEDYPYPIQPMTEILTNPFEDWVCEWCGNMWASDIQSCEKCGGPKA